MNTPIVQLKGAQASYQGKAVLHGIDLTIQPGEKIALVGCSGAGKSTLLRLIYEHRSEDTALVPQESGLVQSLSVYHNVYMGQLDRHPAWYNLFNLIKPFKNEAEKVQKILERLQMAEKLFAPVGSLSGGQKQRTAVARSLFQGGEMLLADEPVSSVDEHQSRQILEALCADFPTVVVALHDVSLALEYCDRIIGLEEGRVVLDRPSAELSLEQLMPLYRQDVCHG